MRMALSPAMKTEFVVRNGELVIVAVSWVLVLAGTVVQLAR